MEIKKMKNKDNEKRLNQFLQLVCAFVEYQYQNGVIYDKKVSEKRESLEKWLVKVCPNYDELEFDELLTDLLEEKFDTFFQILADLECLNIDFDKLPLIKQIDFKS